MGLGEDAKLYRWAREHEKDLGEAEAAHSKLIRDPEMLHRSEVDSERYNQRTEDARLELAEIEPHHDWAKETIEQQVQDVAKDIALERGLELGQGHGYDFEV